MNKNIITLNNWAVIQFESEYTPPEMIALHFKGNVFGHPKFKDGSPIITTEIVSYKNNIFTTYSGSQYKLGEVDPEYEKIFPNALERILKSAENINK